MEVDDSSPANFNDHIFITSYNNFTKINNIPDSVLKTIISTSIDNECLNFNVLKEISDIKIIDDCDIIEYVMRDTRIYK